REQARAFQTELRRRGITATLRRSMGADIQAGCGQLKSAECHGRRCTAQSILP
ncbi:MAG: 23S rRNA (adenine(2503)-C(2))-methyltransferase RlmN, partial [Thermodesulfobacteriota bacterium]